MPPRSKFILAHAIFLVSGAGGLGCQLIWTRMFGLGLGQEMPAVLAVVAAFFGGFALGAASVDRALARTRHPAGVYAGLELAISLWILVSIPLIAAANRLALDWIGLEPSAVRQATVAFGVPFLALLPATAAMGATLPAMERFAHQLRPRGQNVGSLYAANTFGAVVGALGSTIWLLPELGARNSLRLFAGLNLGCAVAILGVVILGKLGRTGGTRPIRQPAGPDRVSPPRTLPPSLSVGRLRLTLLVTGGLGIGLEVLGVRMLKLVLEDTIYTFASLLAVYLCGTALGAAAIRWVARRWRVATRIETLLAGLAASCALSGWALWLAPEVHSALRKWLGDSFGGTLSAETLTAAWVFLPASCFMGATFATLAEAAREPWGGVGRALAWNTLGGALAPAFFGVGVFPWLGAKWTLVGLVAGYLLLIPRWFGRSWLPATVALAGVLALPDLRLVVLLPGERLRDFREGASDSVAVIETADGQRALRVNNRFTMGGTASATAERRQAHLPLLLHPEPKRALFLGSGTGITAAAATAYPGLQVDSVELVPEVVAVQPEFAPGNFAPPGRLRQYLADARRFLRATTNRYDVIVADLFHPGRDGAGALYTREHFEAIRDRLAPGGLFCQWVPLYQVSEATFSLIADTVEAVFPHVRGFLLRPTLDTPALGLVGTGEPMRYPADWFERRVRDATVRERLKEIGFADTVQLLGGLCFNEPATARQRGPADTDDRQIVSFQSAGWYGQSHRKPDATLKAILNGGEVGIGELVSEPVQSGGFADRLRAYVEARNVYLGGLWCEAEANHDGAYEAFIRSAALSADFTTGYAYVLTLAVQMSREKPAEARRLLERLVEARPERPVAREVLERLFPAAPAL